MKFRTTLEPTTALVDLTALVDVLFLMLVFFILTSDILPLKSLNIENPQLPIASSARTSQILVVMDAQNVIYVGSKKEIVDLESFFDHLSHEIAKRAQTHPNSTPSVVLSIDRAVEYGDFLRLFSLAGQTNLPLRLVYSDATSHL